MRFRKSVILLGILLLFAGILFFWIAPAAQCHQMSETPQNVTINTAIPEFGKYQFQLGWWNVWPFPDRPCLLAIGPDGQTLRLPADFQRLVSQIHLSVDSPETALNLAKSYVVLSSPFKVILLSNADMIPGINRDPVAHQFKAFTISAPTISRSDDSYIVQLFSWKQLGGVVERWTITISKNG